MMKLAVFAALWVFLCYVDGKMVGTQAAGPPPEAPLPDDPVHAEDEESKDKTRKGFEGEVWAEKFPSVTGRKYDLVPLPGGLSNVNYKIAVNGSTFVMRIPGDAGTGNYQKIHKINRGYEHQCAVRAHELKLSPELVDYLPEHAAMLSQFVEGDPLTEDTIHDPIMLAHIVETLRQFHSDVKLTIPEGTEPFTPLERARNYLNVGRAMDNKEVVPDWIDELIAVAEDTQALLDKVLKNYTALHCDLIPSNFLWSVPDKEDYEGVDRLWLLDFEYCNWGDYRWDFANIAEMNSFDGEEMFNLIAHYVDYDHDRVNYHVEMSLLFLMRPLYSLSEGLWGLVQQEVSPVPWTPGLGGEHIQSFKEYGMHYLKKFNTDVAAQAHTDSLAIIKAFVAGEPLPEELVGRMEEEEGVTELSEEALAFLAEEEAAAAASAKWLKETEEENKAKAKKAAEDEERRKQMVKESDDIIAQVLRDEENERRKDAGEEVLTEGDPWPFAPYEDDDTPEEGEDGGAGEQKAEQDGWYGDAEQDMKEF